MRYALLLVLLAAGVASCDSTKPANPLTEREAVALLRELVWLTDDEIEGTSTADCSVGGEATVTAAYDEGENGDSEGGPDCEPEERPPPSEAPTWLGSLQPGLGPGSGPRGAVPAETGRCEEPGPPLPRGSEEARRLERRHRTCAPRQANVK